MATTLTRSTRAATTTPLAPRLRVSTMSTPIGPLTILAADGLVCAGGFTEEIDSLAVRLRPDLRSAPIARTDDLGPITEALTAYFAGDLASLNTIAVAPRGGPFQQRVWDVLREIPPGQQTTYRDIAIQLGGRQLARAVGTANATNPIAPIIPCHRVVGTDGRLRGYYWALDRKRWLLDHEQRHARPS